MIFMENIQNEVYNYLNARGFKHSNNGYRYISTAICRGLESPEKICKIENLYKDVAQEFSTTTFAVERSIRYSLASMKFGNDLAKNKEFIASAIDYLNYKVNNAKTDWVSRVIKQNLWTWLRRQEILYKN